MYYLNHNALVSAASDANSLVAQVRYTKSAVEAQVTKVVTLKLLPNVPITVQTGGIERILLLCGQATNPVSLSMQVDGTIGDIWTPPSNFVYQAWELPWPLTQLKVVSTLTSALELFLAGGPVP